MSDVTTIERLTRERDEYYKGAVAMQHTLADAEAEIERLKKELGDANDGRRNLFKQLDEKDTLLQRIWKRAHWLYSQNQGKEMDRAVRDIMDWITDGRQSCSDLRSEEKKSDI